MSGLNTFLDFLSELDTIAFLKKSKNSSFPIYKFLIFTTILGLLAIFIYYYFFFEKYKNIPINSTSSEHSYNS